MSTSLCRRLRAAEKKAYRDDEIVTFTLGDKTVTMTAGAVRQLVMSLQGTALKPGSFKSWSEPTDEDQTD